MRQPLGYGTATFTDPEEFRANVPGTHINLILTDRCDFKARVTWVNLRRLGLARCAENAPRIAVITLEQKRFFVSFPLHYDPPPVWNGIRMQTGEMVLHGCGDDYIHQRTNGPTRWGLISLIPSDIIDFNRALAHAELCLPTSGEVVRARPKAVADLLRVHAQACRLAEAKPEIISHREVARAIEENLLQALTGCLNANKNCHDLGTTQRRAILMARFEKILAVPESAQLSMPDIAAAVGAPERSLRKCCQTVLGMSPGRYERLRRLNRVRTALRQATPASASVAAIANHYGFTQPGRFAVEYRSVFGEAPSTTLRTF